MSRSPLPPETPRAEPEIIPPDRSGRNRMRWDTVDGPGTHRLYVARVGPFSLFVFMLLFAVIAAAVLALFVGAVLFVLPVVGLLITIGIVVSFLRPWLRQRRW